MGRKLPASAGPEGGEGRAGAGEGEGAGEGQVPAQRQAWAGKRNKVQQRELSWQLRRPVLFVGRQ